LDGVACPVEVLPEAPGGVPAGDGAPPPAPDERPAQAAEPTSTASAASVEAGAPQGIHPERMRGRGARVRAHRGPGAGA
jgi:hypothetical protein